MPAPQTFYELLLVGETVEPGLGSKRYKALLPDANASDGGNAAALEDEPHAAVLMPSRRRRRVR